MSRFNEEYLPRLKPSDGKRQRLDFATPSRTSLCALLSIRDDVVQLVHKNMQQMIECFLHMPDNESGAPASACLVKTRCSLSKIMFAFENSVQIICAFK